MAKSGSRGAQCALDLASEPGRFLSTVQSGITLIAIFAGIGYMEWNTIKSGKINIPFLKSTSDQPSSSSATTSPSA